MSLCTYMMTRHGMGWQVVLVVFSGGAIDLVNYK